MIKIFRLECTTPLGPMLGCLTAGFCPSPRPKPPWKAMRNFQPCLPASLLNANVGNSMNDSQNAGLEKSVAFEIWRLFFHWRCSKSKSFVMLHVVLQGLLFLLSLAFGTSSSANHLLGFLFTHKPTGLRGKTREFW